jgi:hypothetical protein
VAVKRFHVAETGDISEVSKKSFENEIKALTEVRHRNIVMLRLRVPGEGQFEEDFVRGGKDGSGA